MYKAVAKENNLLPDYEWKVGKRTAKGAWNTF